MKVYFNSLGVVTSINTTGDSLRQGSTSVTLEAYFDGKNNSDYVATLNFTRHDGSSVSGLSMTLNASNTERYDYAFTDPWFFAKAGSTTLTIYLRNGSNTVIASGQVTFDIEETDYDADPAITVSQYNSLIAEIDTKAPKSRKVNGHALDEDVTVTKGDVGLGNVDNTSDLNKPISSATQAALDGKVDKVVGSSLVPDTKVAAYDAHLGDTSNPHSVTKGQVGLGNVVNTGDSDTPTANGTDKLTTGGAYTLQLQINNLKNIGRFLSIWNATTGVAESNPPTSPYSYKTGDYFRVGTGGTRIPTGSSYTIGGTNYATSQVALAVGDVVYFDGTNWMIEAKSAGGDVYDVQVEGTSVLAAGIANVTKQALGLNNVVNTGDSDTPVSGGTTKFTTGGAYTELAKKTNKVSGATNGHLAALDSNGNLKDSGVDGSKVISNPMTTAGDLIIGGSSGNPTRLAKGSNGQVLKMISGAPGWGSDSAGMSNPMSAQGDIIIGGANGTPTRLAKGNNGQVLGVQNGTVDYIDTNSPSLTGYVTNGSTGFDIDISSKPHAKAVSVIFENANADLWAAIPMCPISLLDAAVPIFGACTGKDSQGLPTYVYVKMGYSAGHILGAFYTQDGMLTTGYVNYVVID